MARFHMTTTNSRGNTRSSIAHSRAEVMAEGWHGSVTVRVWKESPRIDPLQRDHFAVELGPHSQSGSGPTRIIARGILDAHATAAHRNNCLHFTTEADTEGDTQP